MSSPPVGFYKLQSALLREVKTFNVDKQLRHIPKVKFTNVFGEHTFEHRQKWVDDDESVKVVDDALLSSIQGINLHQKSVAKKDQQICKVARGLYIGGISAAKNYNALIHHGITHILNATCVVPNFFAPVHHNNNHSSSKLNHHNDTNDSSPFHYLTIPLYDDPEADLLAAYTMAAPFINQARRVSTTTTATTDNDNSDNTREELEGAVLVHCFAGQSRSAALVIAHLMCEENMSLEEAYVTVKLARNSIQPNSGFLAQLKELEKSRNSNDNGGGRKGVEEEEEEEENSSVSSSFSTMSNGSSVVDASSLVLLEE